MTKNFILNYSPNLSDKFMREIGKQTTLSWCHVWPGIMLINSNWTTQQLSDFIHLAIPDAFFMVAETSVYQMQGWMTKDIWDFVSKKY